jgi:hypothetical protein
VLRAGSPGALGIQQGELIQILAYIAAMGLSRWGIHPIANLHTESHLVITRPRFVINKGLLTQCDQLDCGVDGSK